MLKRKVNRNLFLYNSFSIYIFSRLGRLRSGGAKGPGLFFILPCIDRWTSLLTIIPSPQATVYWWEQPMRWPISTNMQQAAQGKKMPPSWQQKMPPSWWQHHSLLFPNIEQISCQIQIPNHTLLTQICFQLQKGRLENRVLWRSTSRGGWLIITATFGNALKTFSMKPKAVKVQRML